MNNKYLNITFLVLLFVLSNSVFVIDEKEQAIITQFGKPVGGEIISSGLKFKLPFIQTVLKFDKRVLEWDGAVNEIPTNDNKYILIDYILNYDKYNPTYQLTYQSAFEIFELRLYFNIIYHQVKLQSNYLIILVKF